MEITRLKTWLMQSRLQQTNFPLFQVINNLIELQQVLNNADSSSGGGGGGSVTNITQQIFQLGSGDGDGGGDDGLVVPGPVGPAGTNGIQGPPGSPSIFFGQDGEDGDMFPPIVGPQGNAGPTGAAGPSSYFILTEGDNGEDGLMGPPGPAGSGGSGTSEFKLSSVLTLTDAQIKTLNSVPVQIIAAPGANKFIVPITFAGFLDASAGAYNLNNSVNLRFASGFASDLVSGLSLRMSTAAQTWAKCADANNSITSSPINIAVNVRLGADLTGGNVANSMKLQVGYWEIDLS